MLKEAVSPGGCSCEFLSPLLRGDSCDNCYFCAQSLTVPPQRARRLGHIQPELRRCICLSALLPSTTLSICSPSTKRCSTCTRPYRRRGPGVYELYFRHHSAVATVSSFLQLLQQDKTAADSQLPRVARDSGGLSTIGRSGTSEAS